MATMSVLLRTLAVLALAGGLLTACTLNLPTEPDQPTELDPG
ncbi:hypothetical protein [Geminicoccus harenae]|nr:hypothetical protein [Geminicoccus harenae]